MTMLLEEHRDSLLSKHESTLRQRVLEAYRDGAMSEAQRMANITSLSKGDVSLDPESDLAGLLDRAGSMVTWYDQSYISLVGEVGKANAGNTVLNGGVPLTRRERPYKRVEPSGDAGFTEATVRWNQQVEREDYFSWVGELAIYEAEMRGKASVQKQIDDFMGHVWVAQLDENTSPSEARLHGMVFPTLPFYPPIDPDAYAEVHPHFEEGSRLSEHNVNTDEMKRERNEWFAKYHEGNGPNWIDRNVDVDDYTPEFLFNEYLPQRPERFTPTDA
jgi:hypothetical protein